MVRPVNQGLTLVELLVAATILSVAMLAYVTVASAGMLATRQGDYYATAAKAASDIIADLQAAGYANLTSGTTTYSVSGLPAGKMTVTIGALDGNSANSSIAQVDITVTWTERGIQQGNQGNKGQPAPAYTRTLRMSTLICNRP